MIVNLFKYILIMVAGLMASTSCNGNNNASQAKGKVLIIFFSHPGENYGVGNIKVGNTKIVADEIQNITGGDEFEIVAEKSYDMAYTPLTELAKAEQQRGEKPAFKGEVKDISQYQTIFIGGPIWWGTYPQVMFTFFDKYDLNGKTIYPFSTHEGSGLGSVVEDLKRIYPKADVKAGFSLYGHEVRKAKDKIDRWLKNIEENNL
jgi:flavodoxin